MLRIKTFALLVFSVLTLGFAGTMLITPVSVSAAAPGCYEYTGGGGGRRYRPTVCTNGLSQITTCYERPEGDGNFVVVDCSAIENVVSDGAPLPDGVVGACGDNGFLGLPNWYKYLEMDASCSVVGPTHQVTGVKGEVVEEINVPVVVGRVAVALVEILLRIAGVVAIVFVIYGGFRYITSQGEPENAKSARQTILNAIIGLILSLVASQSVAFLASQLT